MNHGAILARFQSKNLIWKNGLMVTNASIAGGLHRDENKEGEQEGRSHIYLLKYNSHAIFVLQLQNWVG